MFTDIFDQLVHRLSYQPDDSSNDFDRQMQVLSSKSFNEILSGVAFKTMLRAKLL